MHSSSSSFKYKIGSRIYFKAAKIIFIAIIHLRTSIQYARVLPAAFGNTEIPQKTKRESNRAHRSQDSRMRSAFIVQYRDTIVDNLHDGFLSILLSTIQWQLHVQRFFDRLFR